MNHAMTQERPNTRTVLSTLWIFVLLNLFAKDIHEFGRPGMLQQIMTGVVDGVTITEELMLLGGVMFEIPILMVLLSQILPCRINRRACSSSRTDTWTCRSVPGWESSWMPIWWNGMPDGMKTKGPTTTSSSRNDLRRERNGPV